MYQTFNQSAILNDHGVVDDMLLQKEGIPYMAATFASYVLTQNLAITATITHLCLYNWNDLKGAWSFMAPRNWSFKSLAEPETWKFWKEAPEPAAEELEKMDPHQRLMLRYKECPIWVYGAVLLISIVVGLICIYEASSGMSWWAFLISVAMASVLILFMGAQAGMTGCSLPVQPIIQMIGAYLEPGRPLTNMYFTLYGKLHLATAFCSEHLEAGASSRPCSLR